MKFFDKSGEYEACSYAAHFSRSCFSPIFRKQVFGQRKSGVPRYYVNAKSLCFFYCNLLVITLTEGKWLNNLVNSK